MQLTRTLSRPRRERARHSRYEAPSGPTAAHAQAQARAKRSGGPEDVALYACECGYAFKAEVTTSVGCPECGTRQAW